MLGRAFPNLLSNAVRHTTEGGAIQASVHNDGDAINVSITNPGPTIPAEDLAHLLSFSWFFCFCSALDVDRTCHIN